MRELQLINQIRKTVAKPGKDIIAGIGDDCAVLKYTKDKYLLWGTDMLIEGTHFNAADAGYERIGRKAVAVNISDIAAMGGLPSYITVNLGLPPKIRTYEVGKKVEKLYKGINEMCRKYGVKVVGGDINRSKKLVIDVSIIGIVEKKRLVRRNGARKGDLVLVTGPVRNGKKQHLDFEPRVEEARFLTARYRVNSMIDVSDGIAPDLGRICAESGTGCTVYSDAVPLSKGLSLKDALYFGESFELLFTMPAREARKLFLDIGRRGEDLKYFVIGEIVGKKKGMKLVGEEGKVSRLKMEGYRHL